VDGEETAMDRPQKPLPKAVDPQSELRRDSTTIITITGTVLSLPFAISASLTFLAGLITEFEIAAGLVKQPWESSRGARAELFGIMAACFFFPAVPGAVLAITGFVRRRTRFRPLARPDCPADLHQLTLAHS
jgi:hypothetical protein